MNGRAALPGITVFLLTAGALVVVIAGLKTASPVVVPFLLAVFVSVVASPPLFWLQAKGLPRWAALTLIILAGLLIHALLVALFGNAIAEFTRAYPGYNARLQAGMAEAGLWLKRHGLLGAGDAYTQLLAAFDPSAVMRLVGNLFAGLGNLLTNAFFILLTVIFILVEAPSFPDKLRRISRHPEETLAHLVVLGRDLTHYLAIKTVVSLVTGVLIAVWLAVLDVDFAVLWGLLAFLFNFVPNIGSIIAAVPAVLLALVQGGLQLALATAGGYVLVNVILGNIIEPQAMGQGLGLSTLAVFLSLIFWGWVLGPVGMLLAVPLTMVLKAVLENRPGTRWVGILLGPGRPGG